MHTRIVTTLALCSALFLCIGCSFDTIRIIDHPARVSEGQQFEVSLYNQFQHLTNSGTISTDIIRDSLHVAIGAPAGWTIESARFYVARDWDIVSLASQLKDTIALALAVRDSSIAFRSRAAAMTVDAGFASVLKGRSYQATDKKDSNAIQVETDSVDSWTCFRGFTNILYTGGTTVDTISIDSTGDTTGISITPVFAWVTLRAPSSSRQDTLIYFSKTATMAALEDTTDVDIGEMSYSAIAVGAASVMTSKNVLKTRHMVVRAPVGSKNVTIDLGESARDASALGIYSLSGALIEDLSPLLRRSSAVISWNAGGERAKTGMYIVRCVTSKGMVSQTIQIVQ
jgi:hypothetical protein